jgi:hypothetical protein
MPPQTTPKAPAAKPAPKWTPEQLLSVKHFGPAIIGEEMHAAAQAFVQTTNDGAFGPALLGDPAFSQAPEKKPAA